jgi:Flp pilus assembly pilin Flp
MCSLVAPAAYFTDDICRLVKGADAMHAVMKHSLRNFLSDESGQDLIEYSLLVAALVVIVAGFFPTTIMPNVSTIFSKVNGSLSAS